MAPIPITILTGFLGAGKTTLLLTLLPQLRAANPNYRLALLKNEFGDLAVDSQLASASSISGVSEILEGCICCNLVGQLSTALDELVAVHQQQQQTPGKDGAASVGDASKGGGPDRIVIETSGSAFPATLALEINRLARAEGKFVLDGVVSVIDVENWKGYEDTSYTAKIQARYTDLIVFNKWELCDERRFDECLDRVGDLDVDVAWVKSRKGWVPMDVVFGVDGGLARSLEENSEALGGGHAHGPGEHQSEVEVLSVELDGPSHSAVKAENLMKLLETAPKDEVYRIKAVMTATTGVRNSEQDETTSAKTEQRPQRYILNWAFGRWTFTSLSADISEHDSSNQKILRMTMILARYQSKKWTKKLEAGQLLQLEGGESGQLSVTKIT